MDYTVYIFLLYVLIPVLKILRTRFARINKINMPLESGRQMNKRARLDEEENWIHPRLNC